MFTAFFFLVLTLMNIRTAVTFYDDEDPLWFGVAAFGVGVSFIGLLINL